MLWGDTWPLFVLPEVEAVVAERREERRRNDLIVVRLDSMEFVFDQNLAFDRADTRKAFVKRVLCTVAGMLLFTSLFALLPVLIDNYLKWWFAHPVYFGMLIGSWLSLYLLSAWLPELRRTPPHNYVLLACFSLTSGLLLSIQVCFFSTYALVLALLLTAVLCVSLVTFVHFFAADFSFCSSLLLVHWLLLVTVGGCAVFVWFTDPAWLSLLGLAYAAMATTFWTGCYLYQLSLVFGRNPNKIATNETVHASLVLFTDVYHMFCSIVGLV